MATGSGKTTVMGMLAAWSILNKLNNRSDARFSDAVLGRVSQRDHPAAAWRNSTRELGEASIYRTRDLVPTHLMPLLDSRKGLGHELARVRAADNADGRGEREGREGRERSATSKRPSISERRRRRLTENAI